MNNNDNINNGYCKIKKISWKINLLLMIFVKKFSLIVKKLRSAKCNYANYAKFSTSAIRLMQDCNRNINIGNPYLHYIRPLRLPVIQDKRHYHLLRVMSRFNVAGMPAQSV